MNWRAVRALVSRDLTVVRRSKAVLVPLIVVPLIISVLVPSVVVFAPTMVNVSPGGSGQVRELIDRLPAAAREMFAGHTEAQTMIVLMAVYLLAPIFLIVPFMASNVIAADSFAGERDRKTLEALLYTPMTDGELFAAKTMVAWIPALAVAAGSFVIYAIVLNAAAWPVMGRVFFPNLMWVVLLVWVAPGVAALGMGAMVLVSMRVRGVQEATQISGALVIPFILLVILQVRGGMLLGARLLAVIGLVVWLANAVVFWYARKTFRREALVRRL